MLRAQDIRQALYHLGEITGEISTEDLLGNMLGRFYIRKKGDMDVYTGLRAESHW